jgi:hypothetical protein
MLRRTQIITGTSITSAPSHAAAAAKCTKSDDTDQTLPLSLAAWLTSEYVSIAASDASSITARPMLRFRSLPPRKSRSAPARATVTATSPARRYCPTRSVVRYSTSPIDVWKRFTASKIRKPVAMNDAGKSRWEMLTTQRSAASVNSW